MSRHYTKKNKYNIDNYSAYCSAVRYPVLNFMSHNCNDYGQSSFNKSGQSVQTLSFNKYFNKQYKKIHKELLNRAPQKPFKNKKIPKNIENTTIIWTPKLFKAFLDHYGFNKMNKLDLSINRAQNAFWAWTFNTNTGKDGHLVMSKNYFKKLFDYKSSRKDYNFIMKNLFKQERKGNNKDNLGASTYSRRNIIDDLGDSEEFSYVYFKKLCRNGNMYINKEEFNNFIFNKIYPFFKEIRKIRKRTCIEANIEWENSKQLQNSFDRDFNRKLSVVEVNYKDKLLDIEKEAAKRGNKKFKSIIELRKIYSKILKEYEDFYYARVQKVQKEMEEKAKALKEKAKKEISSDSEELINLVQDIDSYNDVSDLIFFETYNEIKETKESKAECPSSWEPKDSYSVLEDNFLIPANISPHKKIYIADGLILPKKRYLQYKALSKKAKELVLLYERHEVEIPDLIKNGSRYREKGIEYMHFWNPYNMDYDKKSTISSLKLQQRQRQLEADNKEKNGTGYGSDITLEKMNISHTYIRNKDNQISTSGIYNLMQLKDETDLILNDYYKSYLPGFKITGEFLHDISKTDIPEIILDNMKSVVIDEASYPAPFSSTSKVPYLEEFKHLLQVQYWNTDITKKFIQYAGTLKTIINPSDFYPYLPTKKQELIKQKKDEITDITWNFLLHNQIINLSDLHPSYEKKEHIYSNIQDILGTPIKSLKDVISKMRSLKKYNILEYCTALRARKNKDFRILEQEEYNRIINYLKPHLKNLLSRLYTKSDVNLPDFIEAYAFLYSDLITIKDYDVSISIKDYSVVLEKLDKKSKNEIKNNYILLRERTQELKDLLEPLIQDIIDIQTETYISDIKNNIILYAAEDYISQSTKIQEALYYIFYNLCITKSKSVKKKKLRIIKDTKRILSSIDPYTGDVFYVNSKSKATNRDYTIFTSLKREVRKELFKNYFRYDMRNGAYHILNDLYYDNKIKQQEFKDAGIAIDFTPINDYYINRETYIDNIIKKLKPLSKKHGIQNSYIEKAIEQDVRVGLKLHYLKLISDGNYRQLTTFLFERTKELQMNKIKRGIIIQDYIKNINLILAKDEMNIKLYNIFQTILKAANKINIYACNNLNQLFTSKELQYIISEHNINKYIRIHDEVIEYKNVWTNFVLQNLSNRVKRHDLTKVKDKIQNNINISNKIKHSNMNNKINKTNTIKQINQNNKINKITPNINLINQITQNINQNNQITQNINQTNKITQSITHNTNTINKTLIEKQKMSSADYITHIAALKEKIYISPGIDKIPINF